MYDTSTRFTCPACHGRDVRISAEISVILRPNAADEPIEEDFSGASDDPFVEGVFTAADAIYDFRSDAWCDGCGWSGMVGDMEKVTEGES